jgi:hypothetical protein
VLYALELISSGHDPLEKKKEYTMILFGYVEIEL